jgi:uncharacterized protein with NRDE domain
MLRGFQFVCLILLAVDAHPQYPLIVAANRDEFFARPSAPAGPWTDAEQVIGGRDLEKGGSWLALARGGRLAAVTNYRDGGRKKTGLRSRGLLVRDFVLSEAHPQEYVERLKVEADAYDGFNLIVADTSAAWHFNNIDRHVTRIAPGVHGLSNHLLDTPWPKVERGKSTMERALAKPREQLITTLFEGLREDRLAPDHELPSTGISLEWERLLSPAFIATSDYGTRASTVVLVEKSGAATLIERSYTAGGQSDSPVRTFQLNPHCTPIPAP